MRVGTEGGGNVQSMQPSSTHSQDAMIKSLQKQIDGAKEELRELNQNKNMSPEEKMEKRKEIQQKIQDLSKQISQREMDIRKQAQEKKAKELQEQAEKNAPKSELEEKQQSSVAAEVILTVMGVEAAMDQVNVKQSVKKDLEGKTGVLKAEIELDTARGGSAAAKKDQLAETENKINDINSDMMSDISDINKDIKENSSKNSEVKNKGDQNGEEENDEKEKDENGESPSAEGKASPYYAPIDVRL